MVMCLMPVVPVVADAQTTYEQQQSTEQNNTSNIQVSYVEKVSDIVAAGYETVYETNFAGAQDYAAEAVALTDSYIEVKAGADEDAETVGRLYDYSLVYVDETGTEWTKITSGNVTGYVKNAQLCFGQEAQAVMQESEEQDKELVAGYTLEEAEEKEAREEEERIAEEEAERKAEEEAAKTKQALSSVGTTYGSSVDASDEEVWLLACIIDWEAGSESYEGKLAVANVVLNRVKSGKWGSSITSVIYAPKQFSGIAGASCEAAYSASKGAVNALTRALAKELAPSNIQVNAIACGAIDTDMNAFLSEDERASLIEEIPAGRLGTPAEVGSLVQSLCSDSGYLTGQVIQLDGGWI